MVNYVASEVPGLSVRRLTEQRTVHIGINSRDERLPTARTCRATAVGYKTSDRLLNNGR